MIKVGITGGIGSGKTTVCKLFELLGIAVYYSDDEAKKILDGDSTVKSELLKLLGPTILNEFEEIDRKKTASIVFSDTTKLASLNAIVHPAVARHFDEWCKNQSSPYILKEAAILFESGANKQVDKTILVTAPLQLKLSRVMARDKTTETEVLKRMANQLPDEEKIKLSDFFIQNNEEDLLIPQVLLVHHQLVK
ncbi:MAG: dephospho-CoA kinase [Bacteroidetes bacterium]|nr:dephospho-CoA kinase [Bacteroidota bacterium]